MCAVTCIIRLLMNLKCFLDAVRLAIHYIYRMKFVLLFLCLAWLPMANAQQPSYFNFADQAFEGMDIYSIIQDHSYNYWFATDQGIFKHDGYTYQKIECPDMFGVSVFSFVITSKGVIYCSNLNHQIFKIEEGKCSLFYTLPDFGSDISLRINHQDELIISSSSNMYVFDTKSKLKLRTNFGYGHLMGPPFLTKDHGLIAHLHSDSVVIYANNKISYERIQLDAAHPIAPDEQLQFIQAANEILAVSSKKQIVFRYSPKDRKLTHLSNLKSLEATGGLRFYSMDGQVWMASNISGVSRILATSPKLIVSPDLFTNHLISYIYKDREGNILLGTFDKGVLVIPDIRIRDVEQELNAFSVVNLVADENNHVYFGTRSGAIIKYDGAYTTLTSKASKTIEYIKPWPNSPYLIADIQGTSILDKSGAKIYTYVNGSVKDVAFYSDNSLFLGLNFALIKYHFDPVSEELKLLKTYVKGRVYRLEKDPTCDALYVATSDGLKYLNSNDKLITLSYKNKPINALDITSWEDKILVSTQKVGVLVFKKGKLMGSFVPTYNKMELVLSKILVKDNRIYANTLSRFVILNTKGKILHLFNKSSGLSVNKIYDFCLTKDELWIAHSKGVQRFNLAAIDVKIRAPKLIIRSIHVNDKRVNQPRQKGYFQSNERKFIFDLLTPTLKNRENIRYHYKLVGTNDGWSITDYADHKVRYNALAPGEYRFLVKAENNGVFSPTISYTFFISAPFYQRWWFFVILILLVVLTMGAFYRRSLLIQQRKANQINELNASRLIAIQSQMNPHFIFNSLNAIQDLVLKGDIDNSYTFITKFSNLVRRTLTYSDKDLVEIQQEIKLIELYMSLEQLRFKEDLVYTIELNEIEDILIPPMLIQPFIENALLHGLLHREGIKKLDIVFELTDVLKCTITDNGIGRQKSQEIKVRQRTNHESFAINAIKKRFDILEVHYKGSLGFSYNDLYENGVACGTQVVLTIPFTQPF